MSQTELLNRDASEVTVGDMCDLPILSDMLTVHPDLQRRLTSLVDVYCNYAELVWIRSGKSGNALIPKLSDSRKGYGAYVNTEIVEQQLRDMRDEIGPYLDLVADCLGELFGSLADDPYLTSANTFFDFTSEMLITEVAHRLDGDLYHHPLLQDVQEKYKSKEALFLAAEIATAILDAGRSRYDPVEGIEYPAEPWNYWELFNRAYTEGKATRRKRNEQSRRLIKKLKSESVFDPLSKITLAPFDGSEVEAHKKWFSDPQVRRFLDPKTPYITDPVTGEKKTVSVEEFIDYIVHDLSFAWYRIEHPHYGFIGHACMNGINMEEISFERAITIGEKEYWNQGIARNVGRILLDHARKVGFRKAYASTHVGNSASVTNLSHQFGTGRLEGDHLYFELSLA